MELGHKFGLCYHQFLWRPGVCSLEGIRCILSLMNILSNAVLIECMVGTLMSLYGLLGMCSLDNFLGLGLFEFLGYFESLGWGVFVVEIFFFGEFFFSFWIFFIFFKGEFDVLRWVENSLLGVLSRLEVPVIVFWIVRMTKIVKRWFFLIFLFLSVFLIFECFGIRLNIFVALDMIGVFIV